MFAEHLATKDGLCSVNVLFFFVSLRVKDIWSINNTRDTRGKWKSSMWEIPVFNRAALAKLLKSPLHSQVAETLL